MKPRMGWLRAVRAARGQCSRFAPIITALLAGCATPLVPYTADTLPLVMVPTSLAGVSDQRGRFREVFCAVLDAGEGRLPDHRGCDDALTRVGDEPPGTGMPVNLGAPRRHLVAMVVPGIGWDCVGEWLRPGEVLTHLRQAGFEAVLVHVDSLSGTLTNARQLRDAVMAYPLDPAGAFIVLIGYSKGAVDALEAVVRYPEIRGRLAAIVSAAGSIGGSPLANEADQGMANLLQYFPGSKCTPGDGGAIESLRPGVRREWLATNPLPPDLRYYSIVTFPHPDRISAILWPSYAMLARVDGRNDGQLLFYDQVIPGSRLLAYVNADHWALAVPIARSHTTIGALFVTQNAYPREALAEAVMRYIEEDLSSSER
jgi:hypothetical protein